MQKAWKGSLCNLRTTQALISLQRRADPDLRCPLTESGDTVVYVNEQIMPRLYCTGAHADLDLRRPQNAWVLFTWVLCTSIMTVVSHESISVPFKWIALWEKVRYHMMHNVGKMPLCHLRTAKVQISVRIRAVLIGHSLFFDIYNTI